MWNGGLWMASVPLIVGAVDRDGGDAIVPGSGAVSGKPEASQVIYIPANPAVHSPEFRVVEDPYLSAPEQTDGSDTVVESRRHGGPVLTSFKAKVLASEIRILIEACTGLWRSWPAPFTLGKSR
jgi:hypothetical protein